MYNQISSRVLTIAACLLTAAAANVEAASEALVAPGAVHIPTFELPVSSFLSPEAQKMWQRPPEEDPTPCPFPFEAANPSIQAVTAFRKCEAEMDKPRIERMQAQFAVNIEPQEIAGIPTEVFTPRAGIASVSQRRVLINLHGGGFVSGNTQGESIPLAGLGRIRVVGVDYRMAPENRFPAASEDVAAVYRELLKDHAPEDIGIYGCSAGGKLVAQALVWFQRHGLPAPGAVGIFSTGAAPYVDGDSAYFSGNHKIPSLSTRLLQLYAGPNPRLTDPLLNPLSSREALSKFPPTLLITATRDWGLSNTVYTHAQLVKLGVYAELHVWEGLSHCFFGDTALPESREAYDSMVKFFNSHLGHPAK